MNAEESLTKTKKESDLKISAKEILFGTLLDIQELMEKRAGSSRKDLRSHYQYLSYEIEKVLKNM